MNKQFFPYLISLSLLPVITYAANPQPQVCPSVAAIQGVGVSHNMVQEESGDWFTGRRDQMYGTSSRWTFLIGKIPAGTVDEAYGKAVAALPSLSFTMGPITGPVGKWVCYYSNSQGFPAVAINPPIANNQLELLFLNSKP